MAKKKNTDILGRLIVRKTCIFPGCKNKGRRIGKRQYGDHCDKHKPIYYAQSGEL